MRRPANCGAWPLFRDNVEPSRLNNREPIGINTSQVESLTSYFTRLSWSHCLCPGSLFSGVIAPLLDKPYLEKERNRSTWLSRSFRARSAAVNGTGLIAAEWVTTLEQLTGRKELRSLTLLPWSGILSQRNLLRPHLAWCALCIQQWSDASQPIYEPLLWSIKLVTQCVIHNLPLITRCPSCRAVLHCLAHGGRPGYCQACGQWLGVTMNRCRSLERGSTDADILRATRVGELLANSTSLGSSTDERFSSVIATLIKEVAAKNASHFAWVIGRNKSTICGWTHGSRISLNDLLDISDRLKTTPVRILSGSGLSAADYIGHLISKRRPTPRSRNPFNRRRALSRLERALTYATPPRSMQHVAKILQVDKRVLYKHFPELCKEIAAHAARHRRMKVV
jgi:TniQ